ncbi:MAG: OmpH family outer membrane protein [Barnesiella sp.]|nr:OmpH family outer membrane protein [Barnesiella sp.]
MKRILVVLFAVLPVMAFAEKFGVIDTEALISSLPEMEEIAAQLEAYSAQYERDFESLSKDMDKKYGELQKLPEGTNVEIVKRRVQEIQDLDRKINQFRQTAEADLKNHESAMMTPIRNRVAQALKEVGDEGGFVMIFENSSPVYVRGDVVDVTPLVVEKLKTIK